MSKPADCKRILSFLEGLQVNNDRSWFEANRGRYEEARGAFLGIVGELLGGLASIDEVVLGVAPAECVFRINRDVRFSKDKSPYKPYMGALMGRGGRKSGPRAYYFHLEPGASMLAGGLYDPSPEQLRKLREAILRDARPLKRILAVPGFGAHFGGVSGESLKTAPQGYPKDHPEIELLRKKQFHVVETMSDAAVARADLVPRALESYRAMKPFLAYLESVSG
jgi:uncharacterized protein (TIGR02453 family)